MLLVQRRPVIPLTVFAGVASIALGLLVTLAAPESSLAEAADMDCSDFTTQAQAQRFFLGHDPAEDPHRLDGDGDGISCEELPCPCWTDGPGRSRFDNGEWVIESGNGSGIPEDPFEVRIDGASIGQTRLLTFASRVRGTARFPQVLAIASSGYLRVKSGADPNPPLPFGQSLVLGPAIFGTSSSFPSTTLFFNPQVQQVAVNTARLHRNGTGTLAIHIVARDRGLAPTSTNTNQVMDLSWRILLREPTKSSTRLRVAGTFTFTERVVPDSVRTTEFQSFRLLQISSMFIDGSRHDVDAFRFRSRGGGVNIGYRPSQANSLLPPIPSSLAAGMPIVDSIHTDDTGLPNGNTPSYRIEVRRATGPMSGPLIPRAFFNDSQDLNDDNLGLWIHRRPLEAIEAGARGLIGFNLTALTDPPRGP
jgi:excalibur calcium-binding domain-containing protein